MDSSLPRQSWNFKNFEINNNVANGNVKCEPQKDTAASPAHLSLKQISEEEDRNDCGLR